MNGVKRALAALRDYVERSTHWREGGATRHDALLALGVLGADVPAPYKPKAAPAECWACDGSRTVTTSSNGSGLIEAACLACDDDDGSCPTCGEDGGTSCGMPNCGLLA